MAGTSFNERLQEQLSRDRITCLTLFTGIEIGAVPERIIRSDGTSDKIRSPHYYKTTASFYEEVAKEVSSVSSIFTVVPDFSGAEATHSVLEIVRRLRGIVPESLIILAGMPAAFIQADTKNYLQRILDLFNVDALFINTGYNLDVLRSFAEKKENKEKGLIITCPTTDESQNCGVSAFCVFAGRLADVGKKNKNCVVAIDIEEVSDLNKIRMIRRFIGDAPIFLSNCDKPEIVIDAANGERRGVIVSPPPKIIFTSDGADFARIAGKNVTRFDGEINRYLRSLNE